MNGKAYSTNTLSMIIDVAHHYIEAPDIRDSIIAKCHWEIGLVVCEAPDHKRATIKLTPQETKALNKAIQQRQASRYERSAEGAHE